MEEKRFPVTEIFGPTIQGEGAMAGVFTNFIRFGGCDYRCWWCDTSFSVLPEKVKDETTLMTTQEILDRLEALPAGPEWITLSGGNPALLQLDPLITGLRERGRFRVAVETQGSAWKNWLARVDQLTISLKPPSSGMSGKPHPELAAYMGDFGTTPRNTNLKVPVFNERDYEFAVHVHQMWPHIPFYFSVVTRMGGLHGDFDGGAVDTTDDILARYRWLVERAARDPRVRDVRAFPQLHVLIWGHKRGV